MTNKEMSDLFWNVACNISEDIYPLLGVCYWLSFKSDEDEAVDFFRDLYRPKYTKMVYWIGSRNTEHGHNVRFMAALFCHEMLKGGE